MSVSAVAPRSGPEDAPRDGRPGRDDAALLDAARRVLAVEARGLDALAGALDGGFVRAVRVLAGAASHVVVTGMGKSGHIGTKIAATLASTGTPAFFVHPGEASHGDLGMITRANAVLALSNSGETPELSDLVAYTRRLGSPLVAVTGRADSTLARRADVALVLPEVEEACPLGLAPTTSTTMALALGDALAVALLQIKGFTADDFRTFHPGGRLGAILVRVRDLMHGPGEVPAVRTGTPMADALIEMSRRGFGCTAVLDGAGRLAGIVLSSPDVQEVFDFAAALARADTPLRRIDARVYGPAPAPIARIRGRHRVRLLVKAAKGAPIQPAIAAWLGQLKAPANLRLAVDIDPQSFY